MPVNYSTPLDGTPGTVYVATTEKIPFAFNFTTNLQPGESVSNPSTAMYDQTLKGALVTLPDAPAVTTSAMVMQEIQGSALIAKHTYRLIVSADIIGLATTKRLSISVVLVCPY